MLRIRAVSINLKCSRHPRFRPEDGPGAVKGACPRCSRLLAIFEAHRALMSLVTRTPYRDTDTPTPTAPAPESRQTSLF